MLNFAFTAAWNLTKSAQRFFKDHWSISVLTLGKTLQLTKRQKLLPEEPRPFPIAIQDKNAWPKEAQQAISIPPFPGSRLKNAYLLLLLFQKEKKDQRQEKKDSNC